MKALFSSILALWSLSAFAQGPLIFSLPRNGNAATYLDGTLNYSVPAGAGGGSAPTNTLIGNITANVIPKGINSTNLIDSTILNVGTNVAIAGIVSANAQVVTNNITALGQSGFEHVFDLNPPNVSDPRYVNSGLVIHRHAQGTAGWRFADKNFDAITNNTEKSAIGYGNTSEAAPYGGVAFLGTSDLAGTPPYITTTVIPIRLVQYGKIGGQTNSDFVTLDVDSNGDVNFWRGIWSGKALNMLIKQNGNVLIGLTSSLYGNLNSSIINLQSLAIGPTTLTGRGRFGIDFNDAANQTDIGVNFNVFNSANNVVRTSVIAGSSPSSTAGSETGTLKFLTKPSGGVVTTAMTIDPAGIIIGTFGFSGIRSNLLAPTSLTFPATTVNWTNPLPVSIMVYIDNSTVTGTAVKKNGTQIFGGLSADVTIGLQVGEYFSETYSVGTPAGTYHPFP